MRILSTTLAAAMMTATGAVAETYNFNAGHTEVRFYYDHAGVAEQSGEWGKVAGTVNFDPDDVEATTVSVTIDAASLNTGFMPLDDDLKSARFFDVDKYPQITFTSTGVKRTGPESIRVIGDLTIKETTKPITLDVTLMHMGKHPVGEFLPQYYGGEWLGIEAIGTLIRSDFGVGFGAPLTSDHIRLEISTEMQAQQ